MSLKIKNHELLYANSIRTQVNNLKTALYKNDFKALRKYFENKFSIKIEMRYNGVFGIAHVYRLYGNFNNINKEFLFYKRFEIKDKYFPNDTSNKQSFLRHMCLSEVFHQLINDFESGVLKPDVRVALSDMISMLNLNHDIQKRVKIVIDNDYLKLLNK